MAQPAARGECYCGRVRFEAELPPRFVCHCHCENCRRAHGAAFVTWAGFRAGQVRLTAGADELRRYRTETDALRIFCGTCGSTLFFESPRWEGETHVALVYLDDVGTAPTGHVYADRSPSWCPITDDLPRYGGTSGTETLS